MSGTCTTPGTSDCGTFLTEWGSYGSGNGQFTIPASIATDGSGNVYVADREAIDSEIRCDLYIPHDMGHTGDGGRGVPGPAGVATDLSGSVYVTDGVNSRIQKFDANGTFLTTWGSLGSGNGQFLEPSGVAADGAGTSTSQMATIASRSSMRAGPSSSPTAGG